MTSDCNDVLGDIAYNCSNPWVGDAKVARVLTLQAYATTLRAFKRLARVIAGCLALAVRLRLHRTQH